MDKQHTISLFPASPLAVYIHWPFCLKKCPYCDFNSHVRDRVDQTRWRAALVRSVSAYAAILPGRRVTSIFLGGGTPSLMPPETVAALIDALGRHWCIADDCEITLEANPTSAEAAHFVSLAEAGVNRLSLGVQSLNEATLKFLGREHSVEQALVALSAARATVPRVSFDIIYAHAGQTPEDWITELDAVLALATDHLSLYQLTLEPATPFYARAARGEILAVDADRAAVMYDITQTMTTRAGLSAYEISNHARPGQESRHNCAYWRYDDYIGIGPGAHGRFVDETGVRWATVDHKLPEQWLQMNEMQGCGIERREVIDPETARCEALLMGLRLTSGIDRRNWRQKFGVDCVYGLPESRLAQLSAAGLLSCTPDSLAVTPQGRLTLDAILRFLIDSRMPG